jgi:hypothetical protein
MKASEKATITVTGSTASVKITHPSGASKYELSAGGIIGIVLTSFVLLVALFVVFFDTATSINRVKRLFGIAIQEPDEAPMVAAEQEE